jgi:hypothetical protein
VRPFTAITLSPRLRKGLVLTILVVLVLVEMILVEEFLPYKWRHAIDQRTERIFPTGTYAPHPDMDWEFELDLRQHPMHRAVEYGVLGVLVLIDSFLIAVTWRGFVRLKSTA